MQTPTREGLLIEMATNKLAPSASLLERYLSSHEKSNGDRVDKYGQPYSLSNEVTNRLYPIYWGTLNDLQKDGVQPLDGLLAFYSFFGGGVQKYTNKQSKSSIDYISPEIQNMFKSKTIFGKPYAPSDFKDKTIYIDKKEKILSSDEVAKIAQLRNEIASKKINEEINTMKKLSPEKFKKAMNDIYDESLSQARDEVYGKGKWSNTAKKDHSKKGVPN